MLTIKLNIEKQQSIHIESKKATEGLDQFYSYGFNGGMKVHKQLL